MLLPLIFIVLANFAFILQKKMIEGKTLLGCSGLIRFSHLCWNQSTKSWEILSHVSLIITLIT